MILKPGTLLGPYEITSSIEAGGMGSVFRARDARLSREVAIKVLPIDSMKDPRLVKRFQLEARAAAALQHPNIVSVYDVGESDIANPTPFGSEIVRVRYLVEEFVEGSSLRKLLKTGALSTGQLIQIALGVARGLVAAHEKGLVHRDLKPENILIDKEGRPKIADFGLVRWIYPDSAAPSGEEPMPAPETALTHTGFVVGTLGYMSPEQARGDDVGPPSDLFVFGILLFELATGVAPFARPNLEEAFQAILKARPPDIFSLAPKTSPELALIIERCLEKNISRRYQRADEIGRDLERLGRALGYDERGLRQRTAVVGRLTSGGPVRQDRRPSPALWFGAAVAVLLAFVSGFFTGLARPSRERQTGAVPGIWSFSFQPERCGETSLEADPLEAVITTDGKRIAYTSYIGEDAELFVTSPHASETPKRISDEATGGRAPFFKKDGSRLFYSGGRPGEGRTSLFEAGFLANSSPRRLVDDGEDPALSPDERTLVFIRRRSEGSEIWLARSDGNTARKLIGDPSSTWTFPVFDPTGKELLVCESRASGDEKKIAHLVQISLALPKRRPVPGAAHIDGGSRPAWLNSGEILVRSSGDRRLLVLRPDNSDSPHALPFGAGLTSFSATQDARIVLTRAEGGSFFLWRR